MTENAAPHAIRACTACKTKKLRCLMSDGPPWICQRCSQHKQKCVIPSSRPRQRRKKVYEVRIEQLERNVERMMSLLPSPISGSPITVGTFQGPDHSAASSQLAETPNVTDPVTQGSISAQQAEIYLTEYRDQFAQNFPYVVLIEGATFGSLQSSSPMVLLSILVTASWRDRALQESLNQLFLSTLSSKLIVQGERDLDLLQGLVLYLYWFHLHVTPNTQQAYRLMSIAASMAIDFGITRRPGKGRHQRLSVESVNELPKGLKAVDTEFWSPEARRIYLGCYYIATWYSVMTRKISPLAYSEYLYTCAQSLCTARQALTDADLVFQLEVTREVDKVYTFFNYTEAQEDQCMSETQIQIFLNAFSTKVQDWRQRLPSSFTYDPCHQIWPHVFEAFVREVGISGLSRKPDVSTFRIHIMAECLVSIRNYLDVFLKIPPDFIPSLPTIQWGLLGYAILLAATISLSDQTTGWNIESAHSIIKLDAYIESISLRIKDLCGEISQSEKLKDWYGGFLAGWESIRNCYLTTLQQEHTVSETRQPQLHDLSPHAFSTAQNSQSQAAGNSYLPNTGLDPIDFSGFWMMPDFNIL